MTVCSAPTRERLVKLINKYYFSDNYFINEDNRAENKKTGKILGEVEFKKNRHYYKI